MKNIFLQNNLPVPKIKKIAREDLDDIKIIRQLENMKMFDEIIKEKILIHRLRNPYDIQHVTGQMVEREGRVLKCELNVENCFIRCVVWC